MRRTVSNQVASPEKGPAPSGSTVETVALVVAAAADEDVVVALKTDEVTVATVDEAEATLSVLTIRLLLAADETLEVAAEGGEE